MGSRSRLVLAASVVFALLSLPALASAQEPAPDPGPPIGEADAQAGDAGEAATDPGTDPAASREGKAKEPKGDAGKPDRRKSKLKLRLKGLRKGRVPVGQRFKARGTLRPFAKGERVTLILTRGKKTVKRKKVVVKQKPGASYGKFSFSKKLVRSGRYSVQAIKKPSANLTGAKDRTRGFKVKFPSLRKGARGGHVGVLNRLLDNLGYVTSKGKKFNSATARAVLAYRKVNKMARNSKVSSKIFKRLSAGKGKFKLKHPGAGKHVEADLSRQVMVLAKGGKVKEIYHVSSGAPATPTITGKFRFYRKDAGYNSIGMYYSVYFIRGYATHGYKSVPTYPASHGCLRNPIPDAKHIYKWVDIGDPIYVYR